MRTGKRRFAELVVFGYLCGRLDTGGMGRFRAPCLTSQASSVEPLSHVDPAEHLDVHEVRQEPADDQVPAGIHELKAHGRRPATANLRADSGKPVRRVIDQRYGRAAPAGCRQERRVDIAGLRPGTIDRDGMNTRRWQYECDDAIAVDHDRPRHQVVLGVRRGVVS